MFVEEKLTPASTDINEISEHDILGDARDRIDHSVGRRVL